MADNDDVVMNVMEEEEQQLGNYEEDWNDGTGEEGKQDPWCDVCDIYLSSGGSFDKHIVGRGHQKALRLRNHFDSLTDSESLKILDKAPKVLALLQEVDEPLIGLNYLMEFVEDETEDASDPVWVCMLCGSPLPLETLVKEHFIGRKHRYKYLSKHFKEMSKVVHAKEKGSDKSPLCMEYAQLVEDQEGGKKFDAILVAVNPNKSKLVSLGQQTKKKPKSLMDIDPGIPSLLTSGPYSAPKGGMGPGLMGIMPAPSMHGEYGYGAPHISEIIPMLEGVQITCMEDRDWLIQASHILEQKLVEFNTYQGLDPYDGVGYADQNYASGYANEDYSGGYADQSYDTADYSQNVLPKGNKAKNSTGKTSNIGTLGDDTSEETTKKGPVSLMDLPCPEIPGARAKGSFGTYASGYSYKGQSGYGGGF